MQRKAKAFYRTEFTPPFDPANVEKSLETLIYSGLIFQSAMLQGFAIEAYLKAYWITQGNPVSQNGEYKISSITRDAHNLPVIAEGVGFNLSDTEKEVLNRLSLFVSSYGRYPITKKWSQNRLKQDPQGISHRLLWNNADHSTAEDVIKRLEAQTSAPSSLTSSITYWVKTDADESVTLYSDLPEGTRIEGMTKLTVSGPGWDWAPDVPLTKEQFNEWKSELESKGYSFSSAS